MSRHNKTLTIKWPLTRHSGLKRSRKLFSWGGGSVQEFGGGRVNTVRHLHVFSWHIFTIKWNQYEDKSDADRATHYLHKWSECEKELRGLRLIMLGDETASEVKKVIRDSLGVDLDEGRIL